MSRTRRQPATADILSVCLIHKILCYLSYDEASRMRIISKTWLQAWSILSNLKFKINNFEGANIVDAILERYRDEKIPMDKFEISNCLRSNSSGQLYPQINKWLDLALQNGLKDLVYEDPHDHRLRRPYPFPIIKVLDAKSLRELVLSGCDLLHVSLSSGVANCHSLRKLSLSYLRLDDNMLQTILNSCPLIVSFTLAHCWGLRKILLLNLQKIKSISIMAIGNEYTKIQAPTLEHLSYSGCPLTILEIDECQNLKSLVLSNVRTSDEYLRNLISKSQSLEVLKIRFCPGISNNIIYSSNLVSLEYKGSQIPKLKMAMPSESSQLKHSKIVLSCYNNLNAAWFSKLKKFLSSLTSSSQVSLHFFKCNEINMKELLLHRGVSTPQVDILNVNIMWQTMECPTFVDALLWSCHPKRLNVSSRVEMNKCFIDCLMYMKNPKHSSFRRIKPWHSRLKEVKAFDGKNQPLQFKSGKVASTQFIETEKKEVYFLLDWRYS